MKSTVLMAAFVLAASVDAAAQSVHLRATRYGEQADCSKAQTAVERMVCVDAGLRELDEHLGRYYAAARRAVGSGASCVQTDQAAWLKTARAACRDAACLETVYLNRLAELDPLQPGATAIRNIELPGVAALVWVIGPAADKVAAPDNPKAAAIEISGTILNELSGGGGFVLETSTGEKLPLVLDMFLEGDTSQQLAMLAKAAGPAYRVRGHLAADGARRFFEPSRCVFIYRTSGGAIDADIAEMEKVRARVVTQGKVCGDPGRPCPGFKPNELSFAIAQPFKFDRGRDRSQPFYAVILKSGALCGIADAERASAQQHFPGAKVFLHRHMCEDFGDKVTYAGVYAKAGFVAVYAGETEADARQVLARAKAAGFTDATVRRLQVIVVYQLE
jgi:uncharacterized protein